MCSRLIAMVFAASIILGCRSSPFNSPDSAITFFVNCFNDGEIKKVEQLLHDDYFDRLAAECRAISSFAVIMEGGAGSERDCSPVVVETEWFGGLKELHASGRKCKVVGDISPGTSFNKEEKFDAATVAISCGGVRESLSLEKRSDRWFLQPSDNFLLNSLIELRKEQISKAVH